MTLPFVLFTYAVTWFIVLFSVLPFRLSAPRTIIWNSLLAALITLGIYEMVKSGLVPLRNVIQ